MVRRFIVLGLLFLGVLPSTIFSASPESSSVIDDYIDAWLEFYPSNALSLGLTQYAGRYENLSLESIEKWLAINRATLAGIEESRGQFDRDVAIDARLIARQIATEIERWQKQAAHVNSPELYERLIARAVAPVLDHPRLTAGQKKDALNNRLNGLKALCRSALLNLRRGGSQRLLSSLENAASWLEKELPSKAAPLFQQSELQELERLAASVAAEIRSLSISLKRLPLTQENAVLGPEAYAHKLSIYTDSDITPLTLEKMALDEIHETRRLIHQVAGDYWRETRPEKPIPDDFRELVDPVFADMESNHPATRRQSLETYRAFATEAERFVAQKKIATLPAARLSIVLAPPDSGPAQRIGWVDVPPPFDPDPLTTLYLPNIEDDAPTADKDDFYRSFNNHFNKMIIIHELYPGHFIQGRIAALNPRRARILFPYDPYIEGWATLCEKVALDAGWDNRNKLTYLAHLRKRLENANRAYTSVQTHCNGWTEEQVVEFSVETSLLAPQFAKSLWGRLLSSPLQMTSYFYGKEELTGLLDAERRRLGSRFSTLDFMDTLLRQGPIPTDEFPAIFLEKNPD